MGNFPARSPNGSPVGLVQEPEDGSANKLAVILDAARYQSSDLQGEIAPEPVSFFPIERIGATPDNDPGSLEDGHQRTNVKFSSPSLSSHGGPHDGPPHSVTPRTPSGSRWAKPKYGWGETGS